MSRTGFVRRLRQQPSGSAGFSLLEMLVIIAVIGIVVAVGIPNMLVLFRQARLTAAANQVAGLVQQTRLRAIRDRQTYTVGVSGATIVGRGVLDAGLTGTNQITLDFVDEGLAVFPPGPTGETSPANCLGAYDGNSATYDSLGVASGTLAVCVSDGLGNVLQVALDFPNGQPKVRKYVPGTNTFVEKTSAATAGSTWDWY
ncbi:MAG: hypothetical protein GY778_28225 [bacterium]|nr:hypothetical protein [bacterium]